MYRKNIKIKKANNRINSKKRFSFKFTTLLLFLTLFLLAASVTLAVESSTAGVEIAKLEDDGQELSSRYNDLTDKLIRTNSLVSISDKAESMGFVKPGDIIYTDKDEAIAKLP